jgi:cytosine/adenosine deaminase-related metal-dependent hydrolase
MQTIFQNADVITIDKKRRVISDGAVVVDSDRIVEVGKRSDLINKYPTFGLYDSQGGIILPGLVDCHVHMAQALIRGCADDLSLIDWLMPVWRCQGSYSEEDGRLSAELCILEMLKSGTTAFIETMIASRYGFNGIAQAVDQSGIRAALSKIIMDMPPGIDQEVISIPEGQREEKEATLAEAVSMHEKWEGGAGGRIQVWIGPRPFGIGLTIEALRDVAKIARERNMRVDIHFCEIKEDNEYFHKMFDLKPTEAMEEVGLLGPQTLLIHTIWIDEDEIPNLARTGTHVVHNPTCNMKLGSGFSKIPEMLSAGVNVSLGCDGGPSNNTYDMFREMRMASYIHKGRLLDPKIMDSETVLEMATINGARVMGLEDEIGSLEAGKKADLIILDTSKPHLTPRPDPVSTCVCAVNGSDVDTVVIDGKIIMEDRKVLTLDEEGIVNKARVSAQDVFRRAGVEIKSRWPRE